MRVIEDRCPFSDAMAKKGKKRAAQRNATPNNFYNSLVNIEDDSTDGCVNRSSCSHISKSVNVSACRKALKTARMQCTACAKDADYSAETHSDLQNVWICLQCGYQGCGRSTDFQHSLKHYQQPHSDAHNIVVHVHTEMVWCYECDDEILPQTSKPILDIISLIRKQLGVNHSKPGRPNSSEMLIQVESAGSMPQQTQRKRNGSGGAVTKVLPKLKGLSNLGNTCFFNAVIQSLSQLGELNELLVDMRLSELTIQLPGHSSHSNGYSNTSPLGSDYDDSEGDESKPTSLPPLKVQLSKDKMALTDALVKLFRDMASEERAKQPLNPGILFQQICQKVPRFKGYQQQDSHELLRNLLDALKMEEMKRIQSGILNTFNYKNLDDHSKKQVVPDIKSYGRQAAHTAVDSLFGGYLLSTVLCNDCGKASQIFEPFLDLSLPVHEEKGRHTIPRKGSKSAADSYLPNEEKKGPSKHQQKKLAKSAKKAKKRNRVSAAADLEEAQAVSTSAVEVNASSSASTLSVKDGEGDAAKYQSDNATTSSNTSVGTLVDTVVNNASISSRSTTPKSELGYNTDSESESAAGILRNDCLSYSLEKLSLGEGCVSSAEVPKSRRIRDAVGMSLRPLSEKLDCALYECSILSSLGLFTHPELLTGSNKFACSFCNRKDRRKNSSTNEKSRPTVYTNARKQLLVYSPPAVLTLHLKRFQQNGYSFSKVNRHVEFTISLDLAPYCSSLAQGIEAGQTSVNYLLFAVVEHSGRLNGGHYTAYVRHRSTATLHRNMLQKSLSNQKPVLVILERVASLQREMQAGDLSECNDVCKEEPTSTDQSTKVYNGDHSDQTKALQPAHRWYHISDTHVKEVNERTVLGSQAYLLFYERVR